jgi:hypothetical protein
VSERAVCDFITAPCRPPYLRGARRIGPLARLFSVITDYDHAEFVRTLRAAGGASEDGLRRVSQHLRFGPLADAIMSAAATLHVSRRNTGASNGAWLGGTSRAREYPYSFTGYWELAPVSARGYQRDLFVHFDPGGALPAWLVTFAMNRYLPKVIDAVRARAAGSDGISPAAGSPATPVSGR